VLLFLLGFPMLEYRLRPLRVTNFLVDDGGPASDSDSLRKEVGSGVPHTYPPRIKYDPEKVG
jgi:hypothetical protein